MVKSYRSAQSGVEFKINEPWWPVLLLLVVLPILPLRIISDDPSFLGSDGFVVMVGILTLIAFIVLVISILLRKIIKRVSVDSSARSLKIEIFWSGLRMSKREYSFESFKRFEVQYRMVSSGRSSRKKIKAVALILQSGKRKYLTGPKDQEKVQAITDQLNNLLQVQAGFPQEHFADIPEPQLPETSSVSMRNQNIIAYSSMVCFVAMMVVMYILLKNIE